MEVNKAVIEFHFNSDYDHSYSDITDIINLFRHVKFWDYNRLN